jgi:hypothetical protein
MTERELSACLSVTQQAISRCLAARRAVPAGWRKRGRYTSILWQLA